MEDRQTKTPNLPGLPPCREAGVRGSMHCQRDYTSYIRKGLSQICRATLMTRLPQLHDEALTMDVKIFISAQVTTSAPI